MACTEACKEKTAARQAEIDAWRAQWPNACETCRGAGGKGYPGTFDYRAGVGEPPSFDPCETCVCQGRCPRCGEEGLDPDTAEGPCSRCGWNDNDQEPEPYECGCWYADMLGEEDARMAGDDPA